MTTFSTAKQFFARIVLPAGIIMLTINSTTSQTTNEHCRYFPAYHSIYDSITGQEVKIESELDANVVIAAANNCLMQSIPENSKAEVARIFLTKPQNNNREIDNIVLKSTVARKFITSNQGQDSYKVIERALVLSGQSLEKLSDTVSAEQWMKNNGLKINKERLATSKDMQAYLKRCKDARIEIPETLGKIYDADQDGDIEEHGINIGIEAPEYFIGNEKEKSKIWTRKLGSTNAFCVTFRRATAEEETPATGTICTNDTQSKACFFDNMRWNNASKTFVALSPEATFSTPLIETIHPLDMSVSGTGSDSCKACHVGKNPFIVHPGLKIGKEIRKLYTEEYKDTETSDSSFNFVSLFDKPGNENDWENRRVISTLSYGQEKQEIGACGSCHALTDVYGFESIVVTNAARYTMPFDPENLDACKGKVHSAGCVGWPSPALGGSFALGLCFDEGDQNAPYRASVRALYAMMIGSKKFEDPGLGEACD